MIVDCALYRNGERVTESRSLAKMAGAARSDPDAFVWMGLYEPSITDLRGVARLFGIHPLAVEDAVKAHQRPKLEVYDHVIFVVLRTVSYEESTSDVETGELMVFLGEDFVVTVRHGAGRALDGVRRHLEETDRLGVHGPGAVLHAILDFVVDRYVEVAASLEEDVEEIESLVFGPRRFDDSERVYRLKRELLEFRRAVVPLGEPMTTLVESGGVPFVPDGLRPFMRDVRDHLIRVTDSLEAYDHQLSDIVQAHLSAVAVRQNEDMRKISAWVAIAAVPTMIAGIYGMNFDNMPELHLRYSYFVVLAVMAIACLLMYRAFKRSGWL